MVFTPVTVGRFGAITAAKRSDAATAKTRTQTDPDGEPIRDFRGLLDHLATLTRNTTALADRHLEVLATPHPHPSRAFETH
jgi:hypothetical protein